MTSPKSILSSKLCALLIFACTTSAHAVQYKVVDLGSGVATYQLNNLGQVVGTVGQSGDTVNFNFYWSFATGMVAIPMPFVGINNAGDVLAYDHFNYRLWSPTSTTTVKLTDERTSRLTSFNDVGGYAGSYGMDASAWLTGSPINGASPTIIPPIKAYQAPGNEAIAINNAGEFAGNIYVGGHTDWHADKIHPFVWSSTRGFVDLGTLASVDGDTFATSMNDSGTVVGYGTRLGVAGNRSFVWTASAGMQDIGSPYAASGDSWSEKQRTIRALDINNKGVVVGFSNQYYSGKLDAFLWTADGGAIIMDSLLVESAKHDGWHISSAVSINDNGWIAGRAIRGGIEHGVILIPVPEPASWTLMLVGVAAVLSRRRRKAQ